MPITDAMIEAGCEVRHSKRSWRKAIHDPGMEAWVRSHREIMRRILTAALEAGAGNTNEAEAVLDMLMLCGDLGGKQSNETYAGYLRRLLDFITVQDPNALECWSIIEKLRAPEGAQVTLICDNPDFGMGPNAGVEIIDDWTAWKSKRFDGDTVLEALRTALKTREAK